MTKSGKSDKEIDSILKVDRDYEIWRLACAARGKKLSASDHSNWRDDYNSIGVHTSDLVVSLHEIEGIDDGEVVPKPRTRGRTPLQRKQDTAIYCNELIIEIGRNNGVDELVRSAPRKPVYIDSKGWVYACRYEIGRGRHTGAIFLSPKIGTNIHFIMKEGVPSARPFLNSATLITGVAQFLGEVNAGLYDEIFEAPE